MYSWQTVTKCNKQLLFADRLLLFPKRKQNSGDGLSYLLSTWLKWISLYDTNTQQYSTQIGDDLQNPGFQLSLLSVWCRTVSTTPCRAQDLVSLSSPVPHVFLLYSKYTWEVWTKLFLSALTNTEVKFLQSGRNMMWSWPLFKLQKMQS